MFVHLRPEVAEGRSIGTDGAHLVFEIGTEGNAYAGVGGDVDAVAGEVSSVAEVDPVDGALAESGVGAFLEVCGDGFGERGGHGDGGGESQEEG